MLCLCHDDLALLRFWFQTDLGRENSPSYLKLQAWETFSYHGYAKSPRLNVLNIDWVEFVLKNCEILHSVRGLYDKYSAS